MKNVATIPFKIALGIYLALLLCSCNAAHKIFDKHKERSQAQEKHNVDSSSSSKSDTATLHTSDSTGVKKTVDHRETGIEIEFRDTVAAQVTVTTDAQGNHRIEATGHIKSVKTHQSQKKGSIDSSRLQKKDSGASSTTSATKLQSKGSSSSSSESKTVHQEKKSTKVPLLIYVISFTLLLLLLLYLYLRYRPKLSSWWSVLFKKNTS